MAFQVSIMGLILLNVMLVIIDTEPSLHQTVAGANFNGAMQWRLKLSTSARSPLPLPLSPASHVTSPYAGSLLHPVRGLLRLSLHS